MYGGDDGGHKWRMNNYVFGAHFSEMWRLDLRSFVWRKVVYAGAAPVKRALHAATYKRRLIESLAVPPSCRARTHRSTLAATPLP